MKKAVSSFLAVSALMAAPGVLPHFATGFAQDSSTAPAAPAAPATTPAGQTAPASGTQASGTQASGTQAAAGQAGGQVQMDPAEYTDYDNAVNKQTTPQTQAPALEAYLTKYPKSAVKADVLERLMVDYSQFDPAKALSTADQVLQLNPNDLQAYTVEVVFRNQQAQALTDPAAKASGLDQAASYATKAVAVTKPEKMSQSDFDTQQKKVMPTFYSVIGNAALAKKDYPGAISAFKSELAASDPAATQQPGTALQDTYFLGQAYYASTPPDYINCTFYATRAASYAPDQFKTQFQPLATYCYKKYHGKADGYDTVVTAAKANVTPPADFKVEAAPSDADIAHKTVSETTDLTTLALSDKEYILANGSTEDADKVFATVKGKVDKVPNATVISATADTITVAASDDAVQSKTADFSFTMKTPLKKVPAVGDKVTLIGTWSSYTQKPLLITMTDGEEATKAATAPARRAPVRHK